MQVPRVCDPAAGDVDAAVHRFPVVIIHHKPLAVVAFRLALSAPMQRDIQRIFPVLSRLPDDIYQALHGMPLMHEGAEAHDLSFFLVKGIPDLAYPDLLFQFRGNIRVLKILFRHLGNHLLGLFL